MSGLSALSSRNNAGALGVGSMSTGTLDNIASSFREGRDVRNIDAQYRLTTDPRIERDKLFESRTGIKINRLDPSEQFGVDYAFGSVREDKLAGGKYVNLPRYLDSFYEPQYGNIEDQFFQEQKQSIAELNDLLSNEQILQSAVDKANKSMDENAAVMADTPDTLSRVFGQLAGGIGAGFTDPLNLATIPAGAGPLKVAGSGGLAVARAVGVAALKDGALNAAVEAASIPQVSKWRNTMGREYGLEDSVTDVGTAFAGGAILRGAGEAFVPALRTVRKGAENASSFVLDKMADAAGPVSQRAKDAFKYMSRTAYVDDAAPVRINSETDLQIHRGLVEKVEADLNNYAVPTVTLPRTSKVITPRNELELDVSSTVVDLDELITSDMGNYNQALQPRDRAGRVSSDVRINEIASRLDPAQLGDSRVSNTGAPIVGPDFMVESGNGRIMALRQVYDKFPDSAEKYRSFLRENGYDIEGMNRPVLIRQRVSELDDAARKRFVVFSNEDVADRLSTSERALADARLIDDNQIDLYAGGALDSAGNSKFIRSFSDKAVSPAERNSFINSSGQLSQDGLRRVQGALLAKAYDDGAIISRLMEDTDNNVKTIGNALMDISGSWAKMRASAASGTTPPQYDITADLVAALNVVNEARTAGRPITDYVGQLDLFSEDAMTAETIAILRGMFNENMTRAVGIDKLKSFLNSYVDQVNKVQSAGNNLFGEAPVAPARMLDAALEAAQGRKGAAIEAPTRQRQDILKEQPEIKTLAPAEQETVIQLYAKAKQTKPIFDARVKDIAQSVGGDAKIGKLKAARRVIEKAVNEYNGDYGKIKDMVRATIIVDTVEDAVAAADFVRTRFDIMPNGERNMLVGEAVSPDGYRDIKFNVVMDGTVGEVQINTRAMMAAKDTAHDLYKIRRTLKAEYVQTKDVATFKKINELDAEMKALYDEALAASTRTSNVSRETARPLRSTESNGNLRGGSVSQASTYGSGPSIESGMVTGTPSTSQNTVSEVNSNFMGGSPDNNVTPLGQQRNTLFDENAYRSAEYRAKPIMPPVEIKPTDRFAAFKTRFEAAVKEAPDTMIDLEDGSRISLADYYARFKEDEAVIEALTTCRVA
jgi:ppGpp synthetase/RelA/SpoT-type nucleotidyltranferase